MYEDMKEPGNIIGAKSPRVSARLSSTRYSSGKSSYPFSTDSSSAESSSISQRTSSLKPRTFSNLYDAPAQRRRQLFLYHEQVVTALSGKDNAYSLAALRARASADAAEKAHRALEMIRKRETTLTTKLRQVEKRFFRSYLFPMRTASEIKELRDKIRSVEERELAAKSHMRRLSRKASSDASRAKRLRADANLLAASKSAGRDILRHSSPITTADELDSDEENKTAAGLTAEGARKQENTEEDRERGATDRSLMTDREEGEQWQDRLIKVTITALDSLSAQEEAKSLLHKAGQLLIDVRRCLVDAEPATTTKATNTTDSSATTKKESGKSTLSRPPASGDTKPFYSPRVARHHKLKMAAWKAREAGKRIERAVVLNDQLPIRDLVERNEGNLLCLPHISSIAIMPAEGVRKLADSISESVQAVDDALQESIALQESVVYKLQGDVMGSLTELEQTSVDLEHIWGGVVRNIG